MAGASCPRWSIRKTLPVVPTGRFQQSNIFGRFQVQLSGFFGQLRDHSAALSFRALRTSASVTRRCPVTHSWISDLR